MTTQINLVLADDHEVFREGLRSMLSRQQNINIAGEAENGKELLAIVEKCMPDIVLTDIKMPFLDGIQATRLLAEKYPAIGIIGLSMYEEDRLIVEMMEAGAMGYLIKNASKANIVEAIETVYQGRNYYCSTTSQKLVNMLGKSKFQQSKQAEKPVFTDKEKEIIQLIYDQKTAKEIADIIFLSHRTVEGLKQKIMEKMGVSNTLGMVIYALKNELVDAK